MQLNLIDHIVHQVSMQYYPKDMYFHLLNHTSHLQVHIIKNKMYYYIYQNLSLYHNMSGLLQIEQG